MMADSDTIIEKPKGANATDAVEQDGKDPFVKQGLTSEDIDHKIETIPAATPPASLTTTAKARAALGSAQTIDATTTTKVQLDSETYDPGSNFDNTTNYRFTAPADGYYLVTAAFYISNFTDGKVLEIYIYKNGSLLNEADNSSGVTSTLSVVLSDIISLAVDDYLELFCRHNDVAGRDLQATNTFMSIHLLSNTDT